jgi:hypothetical protein
MRFSVNVSARGLVTSVRELDGQRDTEGYVRAIQSARFAPARSGGVAVPSVFVLTVDMRDMHGVPKSLLVTGTAASNTPTSAPVK